jgi:hypothetical protein
MNTRTAISAALIVCAGCATQESVPKGEVLRSGLCVQRETGRYAQPQSTAGYATVGAMQITTEATTVPLKKNIAFGFAWRASGMPVEPEVEFIIQHPKITRPDGKTLEGFTEPLKLLSEHGIVQSTDCYALSEDHELVPGLWSITVSYKGQVLASRKYTVQAQ